MKRSNRKRIWLLGTAALGIATLAAVADVPSNPYGVIVEKNPFKLNPPPPPPDPNELAKQQQPPAAPLAEVTLTGITSIFSSKQALFEIIPGPGKPAVKPILREGERLDNIEVVSIDPDKNEVVIKNGGNLTNLTFKVVKQAATSPTPPPGQVKPNFPGVTLPGQTPTAGMRDSSGRNAPMLSGGTGSAPATPTPAVAAPSFGAPGVTPTTYGTAGAVGGTPGVNAALNAYNASINAGVDPNVRSIPQRPVRTPQQEAMQQEQHLNERVKQAIEWKVNEGIAKQKGIILPPSPPIPGLDDQ